MDPRTVAFAGMAAILTVMPGADMALVTRSALRGGHAAAFRTTLGISLGVAVHATASALGLSAILHTSASAFTAVKIAGALYLGYLGMQSLRDAAGRAQTSSSGRESEPIPSAGTASDGGGRAFLVGLLTNLLNPKVALFYLTFLPQFIGPGDPVLRRSLMLAGIHIAIGLTWLTTYTYFLGRLGAVMQRPQVKRGLEGVMGTLLIGLGARLAWVHR